MTAYKNVRRLEIPVNERRSQLVQKAHARSDVDRDLRAELRLKGGVGAKILSRSAQRERNSDIFLTLKRSRNGAISTINE